MADRISKEKRSKIMSSIRSKDTKPEIALRKALWAKGLRYRIQYSSKKIDIAFHSRKIAIFIDGCFWHGCPVHSHLPKTNQDYWLPKLKKNMDRDQVTNAYLTSTGWRVLRFWEHETSNPENIISEIENLLKS